MYSCGFCDPSQREKSGRVHTSIIESEMMNAPSILSPLPLSYAYHCLFRLDLRDDMMLLLCFIDWFTSIGETWESSIDIIFQVESCIADLTLDDAAVNCKMNQL